ncbi:right-handed parallel beta-helix repeat-containing protein [Candidatus Finniella inopinata]|uniref:Right-handed parallel beta-helix repeat-containing protein n=1 Tax=Candidatus Finniella inopinata TaxID=1696036 RepID=A0A4Q7DHC5_9PROT|nr:right-handed parallel beta-helix repeat-containing protein [Candidatus Finniella inopinata]RZI45304.1 right-handed parallel beta-helix repeat-containing protein [Candidatus Finniella inopinata]
MSIGYSTLTNLLSLDNIDYLNAKSITTTELYLQGSQKGILTVSTEQVVSQKLSDGQILIGSSNAGYNAATLTQGSNILIANGSGSISVATTSDPTFNSVKTASTYMVDPSMSVTAINTVIANTNYSYIYFKPGQYNLDSYILVKRSSIVLDGSNGATLYLLNNTNQPCIWVGETNPRTSYSNITIKGFSINGNKTNQTTEFSSVNATVPNSGISAMRVTQLYISECNFDYCRSAGLTLVNAVYNCVISNCSSTANYFDAYTFYGCNNLKITECHAYGHTNGAGFSFDNYNQNIIIANCTLGTNKESIFARHSFDVIVSNCCMNYNYQQGIFLAGSGVIGDDRGNERWTFNNNTISNNGAQGIWLQSCKKFTINGNTICNNAGIGCEFGNDTPGNADGTCSNSVLSSNVIYSTIKFMVFSPSFTRSRTHSLTYSLSH